MTNLYSSMYLLNAYRLASAILGQEVGVLEVILNTLDSLPTYLRKQNKNRDKNALAPTRAFFDEAEMFQFRLYEELEIEEILNENKLKKLNDAVDDQVMILRFIKCVILNCIVYKPFNLTIGISCLLCDFKWNDTEKIYNLITQNVDKNITDTKKNNILRNLKDNLIERFILPITETRTGEKKFTPRTITKELGEIVQLGLSLLVPWGSDHVIPSGFDSKTIPLPELHFENEENIRVDEKNQNSRLDIEMKIWKNRRHALIDPICFEQILKVLAFEPLTARVQIPQIAMTKSQNKQQKPPFDLKRLPESLPSRFAQELERQLKQRKQRRKNLNVKSVTVVVDEIKQESFNLEKNSHFRFEVPGRSKIIKLITDYSKNNVLLATLSLRFHREELEENGRIEVLATLEGGKEISMEVVANKNADGEIYSYSVIAVYEEISKLPAFLSVTQQKLAHLIQPLAAKRWNWVFNYKFVGALIAIVTVIIAGSFFLPEILVPRKQEQTKIEPISPPPYDSNTQLTIDNRNQTNQLKESPATVQTPKSDEKPLQTPSSSQPFQTEDTKKPRYIITDANGIIVVNAINNSTGLSGYSPSVRENVARILLNDKPEFPTLSDIEYTIIVQSGDSSKPESFELHPNGEVSRSDRPLFTWSNYDDAEGYSVTVSDPDNNYTEVISSNPLTETRWTPGQSLKRGHIYSWGLTVKLKDGGEKKFPEIGFVKFKILDEQTEETLQKAEAVTPKSHLVLGILYARAGLFEEAEKEFLELGRLNHNSKKVKDLLEKVQSKIKH